MALSVGEIEATLRLRDELTAQLKRAQAQLSQTGKSLRSIGGDVRDAGMALTKFLTLPLAGAGIAAVKLASDFESSFAGVRKTVNATEPEFAALAQGFRDLSREIPVNVNELNRVGEAAGQLGIKKENIVEFSRVMAQLGVTTNLTSDQAATSLARLANITSLPQTEFDRLGSTIVELGNRFATTEAEIVEFGVRIAGAGTIAGLTEDQILAIGTAMSSVGVEAEAGGTSVQKVLNEMTASVATNSSALRVFAETAGMSAEQFAVAFRTDAAAAFESFVSGLGQQGDAAFATLDQLGLGNERVIRAFLSLSNAGDLLKRTLDVAGEGWRQNTALTEEARKRFETTTSQLTLLWNRVKDVGITLGNALLPGIKSAIGALNSVVPVIDRAAKLFASLPGPVQLAAVAVAGLVALAGPALVLLGTGIVGASAALSGLSVAASAAVKVLPFLASSLLAARGASAGATQLLLPLGGAVSQAASAAAKASPMMALFGGALKVVTAALRVLSGPLGWFLGTAAAVLTLTGTWDELFRILKAGAAILGNVLGGVLSRFGEFFKFFYEQSVKAMKAIGDWTGATSLLKSVGAGIQKGMEYVAVATENAADALRGIEMPAVKAAKALLPLPLQMHSTAEAFALADKQIRQSEQPAERLAARMAALGASLEKARAEVNDLSADAKAKLATALRSGAFEMDELEKATALSSGALRLFRDELQKADDAAEKAGKEFKEVKQAIREIEAAVDVFQNPFGEDAGAIREMADVQGFLDNFKAMTDARRTASDIIKRQSMSDFDFQKMLIVRERDEKLKALNKSASNYAAAAAEIRAEAESLSADLQRQFDQSDPFGINTFVGPRLEDARKGIQSFGQFVSEELGGAILAAVQGGGSIGGSIGGTVGSFLFGKEGPLGKHLVAAAGGLGDLIGGKLGSTIGGALGSVIPGLGTLLGSGLGSLVGKLFSIGGPSKAELAGRDAVAAIEKQLRQTLTVQQRVEANGREWAMTSIAVRDAYASIGRTTAQAEADTRALWDAAKRGPEAVAKVGDRLQAAVKAAQFVEAQGGLDALREKAKTAGASLDAMLNARTVQEYEEAIGSLNERLAFQDQAMRTLSETVGKYKFSIEELGPAFAAQELGKQARELFQDWQVLTQAGVNVAAVGREMADSVNEYLQAAVRAGVEVPEHLRPMLEQMADMGLLTDDAGEKIHDLEDAGVRFGASLSDVVDAVRELTDAIRRGLGLAIEELPTSLTLPIDVQFRVPDLPDFSDRGLEIKGVQEFATGSGGIRDFGAGQLAMLHGREGVFTEGQIAALITSGGEHGEAANHTLKAVEDLNEEVAGLRRDFKFLVPGLLANATVSALSNAGANR